MGYGYLILKTICISQFAVYFKNLYLPLSLWISSIYSFFLIYYGLGDFIATFYFNK